ncbi:threonine aspartase [Rhizoctonia solani AG-1 IB]|uniref:Threonine aspartase n=1 Tax=Thanatephorus cucumeris (strain AG1-IB / isolate 7/3/14) TaxID=1108050 RepID=A0A0B7FXN9_THACB|nr:threonine aspartase [Rhizoctonia solani AG-1 IB]
MLVIAVHGGAGTHSGSKDAETLIRKGLKEACISGQRSFRTNQDTCQAIQDSIVAMEDDQHFNAGTGSNLTIVGTVECDASIMNSAEDFGAVGAMRGVKNPIKAAYRMLVASKQTDPHGRIPPMLVSGDAPSDLAVDPSEMITEKAISEWKRWQMVIQTEQKPSEIGSDSIVQDTVGAVSCTIDGEVSAGVSSGGILLKPTGRIGEAACFGAGCWASGACGPLNAVACSISGAGEMIMRAFLAKELAESVRRPDCDAHEEIERTLNKFINMCAQRGSEHANAGVILIVGEPREDGTVKPRLWCGFTTHSFAVAYASSLDSSPKSAILRRPNKESGKPGLYITSLPLD